MTSPEGPEPASAARVASTAMPARRNLKPRPSDYLAPGGTWPEGPLNHGAPPEAAFVMEIARRINEKTENRSLRSLARDADVDKKTIANILTGATWCEAPTIYRLERALQTHLWQRAHVKRSILNRPDGR